MLTNDSRSPRLPTLAVVVYEASDYELAQFVRVNAVHTSNSPHVIKNGRAAAPLPFADQRLRNIKGACDVGLVAFAARLC
jgi:hypothetical protein